MIEEIKYEIALKKLDVENLLHSIGIDVDKSGNELWMKCPNPDHDDKNPSASINIDPDSKKFLCFSCFGCGCSGRLPKMLKLVLDIGYAEAKQKIIDFTKDQPISVEKRLNYNDGIQQKKNRRRIKIMLPNEFKYLKATDENSYKNYLIERGVLPEFIEQYEWGYCATGKLKKRVVLPMMMKGKLVNYWARHISIKNARDKIRNAAFSKALEVLWPFDELDFERSFIWVTESPFNYFALRRLGLKNIVCTIGSNNQISEFKINIFEKFKQVRIVQDGDHAGLAMIHKIFSNLKKRCEVMCVDMPEGEDAASLSDQQLEKVIDSLHPAAQILNLSRQLAIDYAIKKNKSNNNL